MECDYEKNVEMIQKFPYQDLLNIAGFDLNNISRCLSILIKISKVEEFYENLNRVSTTVDFILSHLSVFDVFQKDLLAMFITLLKEIVTKLTLSKKLNLVLKNVDKVLEIFVSLTALDIFCNYCARTSVPILTDILKLENIHLESMEKYLGTILEKFDRLLLTSESDILHELLLQRCRFNSNIFSLISNWLMKYLEIFKNTEYMKLSSNSQQTTTLLRIINTFYQRVSKVIHLPKYQEIKSDLVFRNFLNMLMTLTPTFIRLCGCVDTEKEAKIILVIILFEFLHNEQNISYVVESTIREEIPNFPLDVHSWWRKFSHSFFWLCHILYVNKCYIWGAGEIFQATTRLIYTRKYKKTITIPLLKSLCYIYPLAYIQSPTPRRKMLGDDIVNIILPDFAVFLDRVLSLTSTQLMWLLSKTPTKFRKIIVIFWLKKLNEELSALLKHCLVTSKSEYILIEILLNCEDKEIIQKCVEIIEDLNSPALSKNLHNLIPKFLNHSDIFPFVVRAVSCHLPEEQNISLLMLTASAVSLVTNEEPEIVMRLCQLSKRLLSSFAKEKEKVQFFCNDVTLIRVLIYRVQMVSDDFVVEILILLRTMLRYQRCIARNPSNTTGMKMSSLLKKQKRIAARALDLLWEILRLNTLITLDKNDVLFIQHRLFDLSDQLNLSSKCHLCLMKMIKFYPALLYSPTLSSFIEDLCFCSNKQKYSSGSLKLILAWIHMVALDGKGIICFLPKENVLRNFFTGFKRLREDLVKRNLYLISQIYSDC